MVTSAEHQMALSNQKTKIYTLTLPFVFTVDRCKILLPVLLYQQVYAFVKFTTTRTVVDWQYNPKFKVGG